MAEETEKEFLPELKPVKRVSEVSTHGRLEGEPTTLEAILDDDVLVLFFQSRKSQFEGRETYLAIQIEHEGEKKVISTGSGPIIDTFESIKPEDLPLIAKFSQVKGKQGRKYYIVT